MKTSSKWLWCAAFLAVWCALRVFWLTGDSGILSFWEYGYHATDEGYYLSGGKELYLWHSAVDLARGECLTYAYAAGMQWLSYLSHLVFGLSTWAWRIPFFCLYLVGAAVAFLFVARRSGLRFAFVTCLSVSVLPLIVVYERTASNDTLMAALLVVSYVIARGKGVWRIPASAFVVSLLILIKPALWALLAVPLAGVLSERKTRSVWLDVSCFLGLTVALAFGWKGLVALTVSGDAARLGLTTSAVLKKLNANYGLPNFFDFLNDFKAFAAFPRDPSYKLLGPLALLISALPLAFLVRQLLARKWNANLLLYLIVPAYVGAASVMNTLYTHYFLPMLVTLPLVLSAMREDMAADEAVQESRKDLTIDAAVLLVVCGLATYLLSTALEKPQVLQNVYSRIYNLPSANPWSMTWPYLLIGLAFGSAFFLIRHGLAGVRRNGLAVLVFLFAALSVTLAAYPAVHLAPRIRLDAGSYLAPMCVNFVTAAALFYVFFLHPGVLKSGRRLVWLLPVLVVGTYVATPTWRAAARELLAPATHIHAEVAAELRKLVPDGAVVIGERTDQAFLSLPIRTAATFSSGSDATPVIKALWDRDPNLKLFAFADSQHAYNLQHYREHQNEFQLQHVKTFKMPSFATGQLADVYLCQIIDKRESKK